jgi:molecular chaperone DnaK
MENINFGIDLGTTNSGIGKFQSGKVQLFKNPVGFRDTLPSVVAYRNNRILVGDKARELTLAQPENVFSSFKRKMGSDHLYRVPALEEDKTAIDFSTLVLKELFNFVGDEKPKSAVITIPASFDTIQSNATKTAGLNAGLTEVVLLQEPIAACLAYANTQNIDIDVAKTWLVYDFGGGTFDVALVKIDNRELKVIDHEGNNFLGGLDIDNLMLEHLFCPALEKALGEEKLWKKMVNTENKEYYRLFIELLYRAEEAKKELSLKPSVFVELEVFSKFVEFEITQKQFNELIHSKAEETIQLTKRLLEKNNVANKEIERIILVGGTTYIPYIRTQLQANFDTLVDSSIDPTTAIILGASYFAGTKTINTSAAKAGETTQTPQLKEVKLVYEVNSQDEEELLTGVAADFKGFYRITRTDGGFDTGLNPFQNRFNEFLKLIPKTINFFDVKIFDKNQEIVFEKHNLSINHGVYNISGQPLPNDICLEVDDTLGTTYLERIFKKNDILPLSKKVYKTISKTMLKDSGEKLIINIVEGKAETSPASNLSIGYLEIDAADLNANLLKGTDLEIDFEISESRDLTVGIYIGAINLEINEVFNASSKQVSLSKLKQELEKSLQDIEYEIEEFTYNQIEAVVERLNEIRVEVIELLKELIDLEDDLVTDKIYNVEERKRKAFQQFDELVRKKNILAEIEEYQLLKNDINEELLLTPNAKHGQQFHNIVKGEQQFLSSNQLSIIKSKIKELQRIAADLHYQKDDSYVDLFYHYSNIELSAYANESTASRHIANGEKAIEKENYKELRAIVNSLYNLLKVKPKDYFEDKNGTLGLR